MSIYLNHVTNNISASSGSLLINGAIPQATNTILTSVAGVGTTGTGFLKLTNGAASLDTSTYLTGNQTITFSGDASGSGTTAVTLTLANSGVSAGSYTKVTVDSKGRVTGGSNPNTLSSFGISDAQPSSVILNTLSNLSTSINGLVRMSNGSASLDTSTYLTSVPTASTTTLGLVKVDGTTITISNGVISGALTYTLPTASTSVLGGVKVDGSTIAISNGVISSIGGAILSNDTSSNVVQYIGMSRATSGMWTAAYTSDTKLYFNPSSGTISSTNFNSLSDERKKKNIVGITNGIEIIKQLNGVEFDYIDSNKHSSGVTAQALEQILPFLIDTGPDDVKTVNYSGIIAYLIESIKTLEQRIKALEG